MRQASVAVTPSSHRGSPPLPPPANRGLPLLSPLLRRALPPLSASVALVAALACGDSPAVDAVPLTPSGGGTNGASGSGPGGGPGAGSGGQAGSAPGGQGGSDQGGSDQGGSDQGGAGGSDQGGAGGGGGGGAGGSGGSTGACLDAALYAELFALDGTLPLCVTRVHAFQPPAGFDPYSLPTWGRHGGPLTLTPGATAASLSLQRWSLPAGPTDPATFNNEAVTIDAPPSGNVFWGPPVDLPFFDWTLVSYTGQGAAFPGEVLLLDASSHAVVKRDNANGFYNSAGLADPAGGGYLVYTGLSPLADGPLATSDSAVYAARSCAEGFAGTGCEAGHKVGDWDGSSGPVAVDAGGRGFFALSAFGGALEVRGFARSEIVDGVESAGVTFVQESDVYAQSLAAVSPSAGAPGYLFVDEAVGAGQRIDAITYEPGTAGEPVKGAVITSALTAAADQTVRVFGASATEVWVLAVKGNAGRWVALQRKP
jgi:hypothetical protein